MFGLEATRDLECTLVTVEVVELPSVDSVVKTAIELKRVFGGTPLDIACIPVDKACILGVKAELTAIDNGVVAGVCPALEVVLVIPAPGVGARG